MKKMSAGNYLAACSVMGNILGKVTEANPQMSPDAVALRAWEIARRDRDRRARGAREPRKRRRGVRLEHEEGAAVVKPFKPLLAYEAKLDKLKFPLLVSPKLDGIRCIIHPELGPVTRNLKPIVNKILREQLTKLPAWLDGELIAGEPTAKDCMQRTTSVVMSRDALPEGVKFWVFDQVDMHCAEHNQERAWFRSRYDNIYCVARGMVNAFNPPLAIVLPHEQVDTLEQLMEIEDEAVRCGFEGIMLRDPKGVYKFGRSTVREGILLKVKRFADMEGYVVDFIEKMHNENEATKDNLGRTKRSTKKEGKVPAGTLGALQLKIKWGGEWTSVEVGGGFTDEQRAEIWANQNKYNGACATFKYQPSGSKDRPRFPVFKYWRGDL